MMNRFLSAAAILSLAACSGQSEEQSTTAPDEATMPAEAQAETATLEAMPEPFRGHWEFDEGDCDNPASEGRLEIDADQVTYYESSAAVTAIEQNAPRTLTVEHLFSGEGEEWTETLGYELSDDGERLTVTTAEGSLSIRMRCA